MAAIVSQLAAANRRRKANKKNHVNADKCVYTLPPFDPCFKPEVHNRYVRHKHAQLAHQEFIERIGDVSPVHIHQLEELGSRRIKETKRNPNVPNGINQDGDTPPKKSAEVILPTSPSPVLSEETDYKIEGEGQAELRLLDEETVQASDDINTNIPAKNQKAPGGLKQEPEKTQAEKRAESESVPASFRCQMVMAICAVLGLIPLLCIVIYLVGMFWMVPSTLNLTS